MRQASILLPLAALGAAACGLGGQAPPAEKTTMKSFVYKKTPQAELKIHVHYPKGWKKTPPTLLLYGANDRFYREDAREFVAAAKKVGAEVKLLSWPRVGHGFFNREPYLSKTLRAAAEFRVAHGYLAG